jgi:hypothetical protein
MYWANCVQISHGALLGVCSRSATVQAHWLAREAGCNHDAWKVPSITNVEYTRVGLTLREPLTQTLQARLTWMGQYYLRIL